MLVDGFLRFCSLCNLADDLNYVKYPTLGKLILESWSGLLDRLWQYYWMGLGLELKVFVSQLLNNGTTDFQDIVHHLWVSESCRRLLELAGQVGCMLYKLKICI